MTRLQRLALSVLVACFTIGLDIERSFADGWEVNNIWWNIIINWRNRHQTVCIAEQYNQYPLTAKFDIYPGYPFARHRHRGDPPGHGTATQFMQPFVGYRIFAWLDGTKPDPQCILKSWQ